MCSIRFFFFFFFNLLNFIPEVSGLFSPKSFPLALSLSSSFHSFLDSIFSRSLLCSQQKAVKTSSTNIRRKILEANHWKTKVARIRARSAPWCHTCNGCSPRYARKIDWGRGHQKIPTCKPFEPKLSRAKMPINDFLCGRILVHRKNYRCHK